MPSTTDRDEIVAIDLFCGAGGFSEALQQVCEECGFELTEAAINHWQPAISTHETNHPDAHQYHSKVEQLHPPAVLEEITGDSTASVDILTAGPECTHFSKARAGKPVSEQKRMSPWQVLDWLEKLDVEAFIIENVEEITSWGPVEDGEPSRDGSVFDAWINALNQLGYAVDWTVLNAADFGDPTSRSRFFLVGKKDGTVTFPEPTHGEDEGLIPQRTAAEIIDWSDLGGSIWTRDLDDGQKTPPKQTTMRRIAEGLRRHCCDAVSGFANALDAMGRDDIRELRQGRVVPRRYASLVADIVDEPFLVPVDESTTAETLLLRQQDGAHPVDVRKRAVPTIAKRGGHAIATPTLSSLIEPKNGPRGGLHSNPLYHAGSQPLHTLTTDPRAKVVTPTLVRYSHGGAVLDIESPMPTIATERGGVFAIASPYLAPLYSERPGQRPRTRSLTRPLMTTVASKSVAGLATPMVTPFIVDYEGPAKPVDAPLGTITSRDRFALCVPELWPWGLDIRYRMLQPRELKQAQGFPKHYTITGTKQERCKQIGNAVPVTLAKQLCSHVLAETEPSLASFGGGLDASSSVEIPSYYDVVGTD